MLLALSPGTMEFFAVRIVHDAPSITLIHLELAFIALPTRPQVSSTATLLAILEVAIVDPSIWPLEETHSIHLVIDKWTLVHLSPRCDAPTMAIDLAFFKEALKECIVGVDFEANSIWLSILNLILTSVDGATPAWHKLHIECPLGIHVIINLLVLIVVKWTQHLVDVLHCLVLHVADHVLKVL